LFVTTKYQITPHQQRGWCQPEIPIPCNSTTKCMMENIEGICNEENFCEFFQWCPSEDGFCIVSKNVYFI